MSKRSIHRFTLGIPLSLFALFQAGLLQAAPIQRQEIESSALEEVTVFHGMPGGFGSVARYESQTGRAMRPDPKLIGMRWLDFEVVGRTQFDFGQLDKPQLERDLPGNIARVTLPNGHGTLYHYHRQQSSGPDMFGYLHIPTAGTARSLLERPAVLGSLNPFLPRIAIDPEGTGLLFATHPLDSGDLFEAQLQTQSVINRTQLEPPLRFGLNGIGLGSNWGYGVSSAGVYRFMRTPGAQVEQAPALGAQPAYWNSESAMSHSGTAALVLGGINDEQLHAFSLTPTGPMRPANALHQDISPAGFLPDFPGGPFLSISDDGNHLAWVATFPPTPPHLDPTRECMLANLRSGSVPEMATADDRVMDTLEEVGRIRNLGVGFTFAVGETNDISEGGLEAADFFSTTLSDQGAFELRNITGTMSDNTFPFTTGNAPTLAPSIVLNLAQDRQLIFDEEAEAIWLFDPAGSGLTRLIDDVKETHWMVADGAWALCSILRRSGSRPRQLWRLSLATPTLNFPIDLGSPTHRFDLPTPLGNVEFGYRTTVGLAQSVSRVTLNSGQGETWSGILGTLSPPLISHRDGRLGMSPSAGLTSNQVLWNATNAPDVPLQHPGYPGHFLQ